MERTFIILSVKIEIRDYITERKYPYYRDYREVMEDGPFNSFSEAEESLKDCTKRFKEFLDERVPGWTREEVEENYNIELGIYLFNADYRPLTDRDWIKRLQKIYRANMPDEKKWEQVIYESRLHRFTYDLDGLEREDACNKSGIGISKEDFLRKEPQYKVGDVVTVKEGGIYIVSDVPACITDILADYMSDEEDCYLHFERFEYGLEGIEEDGHYRYWEHGWTGYISEKNMKRFEGEIKNESLLPILQKMVLGELPWIYDVFDRSLVDTGYNHMIPYTKLFKLDEKEIERN